MSVRHIVLTGPMGSGKTTVGSIISARLGRPLIDSDQHIEAKHGMTGRELAATQGVNALHEAERDALRGSLASDVPSVIAAAASTGDLDDLPAVLGGDDVVVVLLAGDAEVLAKRAALGGHRREIDSNRSQELAKRRHQNLRAVTDGVIDVTEPKPEEIAALVLSIARVNGVE
jgi:shikimate kinase